ncbi:DHHA1 domain-containing protein [Enterobacter hormaechei]
MTAKIKAGELINFVAQQISGKGGGRPDMAQLVVQMLKRYPLLSSVTRVKSHLQAIAT